MPCGRSCWSGGTSSVPSTRTGSRRTRRASSTASARPASRLPCDAEADSPPPDATADVFVVDVTGSVASRLVHKLRDAGIRADRAFDDRSMKAQFKLADRSGARLAVVVGDDELAAGKAKVQ